MYSDTSSDTIILPPPRSDGDILHTRSAGPAGLCPAIDAWIARRGFARPGITLGSLAAEIGTNRTYLSSCINARYGVNFRTWLGRLRVAEVQRLLLAFPDLPVVQIAEMAGAAPRSSFHRQFFAQVGCAPLTWRCRELGVETQSESPVAWVEGM